MQDLLRQKTNMENDGSHEKELLFHKLDFRFHSSFPGCTHFKENTGMSCWYLVNGLFHPYTSSTAQGGGGSFKNRKRIGEIDCCE